MLGLNLEALEAKAKEEAAANEKQTTTDTVTTEKTEEKKVTDPVIIEDKKTETTVTEPTNKKNTDAFTADVLPDYLQKKSENANDGKVSKDEKGVIDWEKQAKQYLSEVETYKKKIEDPLVKALLEYKDSGGDDLGEFVEKIGVRDVNKMDIRELIKIEAESKGFKDDELLEVIEEEFEKYESSSRLSKKEIADNLKAKVKNQINEKVKNYSTDVSKQRQENQKAEHEAALKFEKEATDKINALKGTKMYGLEINDDVVKELQNQAGLFATRKFDKENKFIGWDSEGAIDKAYKIIFFDKILEKNIEYGWMKALETRSRISTNKTSAGTVSTPSLKDELEHSRKLIFSGR